MNEAHSGQCPVSVASLSVAARKAVDPATPLPARMMAARGLAPMPPRELVTVQYVLTYDPDEKIQAAARQAIEKLDARVANAVLGDTALDPHVLGFLAESLAQRDAEVEKVLLNPSTPSRAFVQVAAVASQETCELIANNQARLLDEPEIARGLIRNPRSLKSTTDRVIDFLVRSGILLDGLPEFELAVLRLGTEDRLKAADNFALPSEFVDESFLSPEEREQLAATRRMIGEDEVLGDEVADDARAKNIDLWLREATLGEKVAMATKGNKVARARLLRDSNRVVAMAAITSPAITDPEVVSAAQSRIAHQDVIAFISRQKDWLRNYQVKVALVNNPKCPVAEAMKIVPALQRKDLRAVSVSKNVSGAVRNQAIQLQKTRT
ncbi:MAG: hypothetical protein IT384_33455 [Deltaproteobacteria bacterium]|nr:hypothetical protein [Deltaproteobacteria bacterium]